MKTIRSYLQEITFKEKYAPVAFLIIAVLGFGLLVNKLGFYQDDWPYIVYAFNNGIPSLTKELFFDSRPNAAWLYIGLFNLLRFNPIGWHVTALIFRWLTATCLWYFFKRVWPEHKREATFVVLIFIVHPFFLIQPYAVNSILYWSGYFFFAASLLIMARTVTEKKNWIILAFFAAFLEGLHLFTSEYFVGMVMIRPLVLYWLLSGQESDIRARFKKTVGYWLPYLAALIAYVVWRIFLFIPPPGGDRNIPKILYGLFKTPAITIPYLVRTAAQDSAIVTFTSWYRTFTPELFALGSTLNWFMIAIAAVVFIVTFFFLTKTIESKPATTMRWLASPLILGALIIFLGMTPIWMVGQDIVTHKNQFAGSRFGIGAMLGAAIIVAVLIENFIDNLKKKIAAVSICVALAASMHFANGQGFAFAWEKQVRFSNELIWRAPQIETGTAIFTDEEILGYMGSYSTSFAIITDYQPGYIETAPYWYFPFYTTYPNIDSLLQGIPLEDGRANMNFSGNSDKMLLVSFNPEMRRCLWILSPDDIHLSLVSDDMRRLSAGSDISLIKQSTGAEPTLPESIYGKQDNKTWCYYFEKADLARQYKQWDEIARLWEESQSAGTRAYNGFEYVPFIEGYGHRENWEQVETLIKYATQITGDGVKPSLCNALDRLAESAPASQKRDNTIRKSKDDLKCEKYQ